MYPATSIFIAVGQLAIAILVLFSYPLQVHPCRNCLDKVFHFGQSSNAVKPIIHDDEEEEEEEEEDDGHGHSGMSKLKHLSLTTAIVVSGFMIAYMVDDLQIGPYFPVVILFKTLISDLVLSFVGATGSTTISFILPGLLFWEVRGLVMVKGKDNQLFDTVDKERCNSFQDIELGCFWVDGIWDLCFCFLVSAHFKKKENVLKKRWLALDIIYIS